MEFPKLGQHCSEVTCNKLDFLPVKCDACQNVFCHEHMSYKNHSCPSSYKKDVQVPVCPLCNAPVPAKRGEQPDIAVSAHIDNNCQSDTATSRRKIFVNRCSAKGCKVKELVVVNCSDCQRKFCLKHRHPTDHQCEGSINTQRRKGLEAALSRKKADTTKNNSALVQGSLSEDEALARALAASMTDTGKAQATSSASRQAQEDDDFAFARALAESELMQSNPTDIAARETRERCSLL